MNDLEYWEHLVAERYFVEAAYLAGVGAASAPSARTHMLAGIACCGCMQPQAAAQRLADGDPVPSRARGGLRVSFATRLPYAGFDHLIAALRAEPELRAPEHLRAVIDEVADDLAYASRREVRTSSAGRAHSPGATCVAAALLLLRLTGQDRELPRIIPLRLETAQQIIAAELAG